nr:autotransporter-associated beta strand repeat-containing protein [Brucella abortus]
MNKSGAGQLTLSSANTYGGATTIDGGVLLQGESGAFSSSSAYRTGASGTVDLGGFDTNMASLDNAGLVNFGGTGAQHSILPTIMSDIMALLRSIPCWVTITPLPIC